MDPVVRVESSEIMHFCCVVVCVCVLCVLFCFFFQAEDGIRDLVRSRGLGDVYKRQVHGLFGAGERPRDGQGQSEGAVPPLQRAHAAVLHLSLIHI